MRDERPLLLPFVRSGDVTCCFFTLCRIAYYRGEVLEAKLDASSTDLTRTASTDEYWVYAKVADLFTEKNKVEVRIELPGGGDGHRQ